MPITNLLTRDHRYVSRSSVYYPVGVQEAKG